MFRLQHLLVLVFLTMITVVTALLLYNRYHPLHHLSASRTPFLQDDMDRSSLLTAARTHLAYLDRQEKSKTVSLGEYTISYDWLHLSLSEFIAKVEENPDIVQLNAYLKENYYFFQAGGRKKIGRRKMLVTGYYEPLFAGSPESDSRYSYPIYMVPPSLKRQNSADNTTRIGRYNDQHQFVDYWSRSEIEKKHLLFGYELAYLADPFDAFLLHVQGSGRLQFPDGSIKSVQYAASNGLGYNSIGKLLVDENKMTLEQTSIPAIRAYLNSNPEELERILHHNPRFIFFKWGDDQGPRGSLGEILTPGRSIAIDHAALPGPTLAFLVTRKPVLDDDGSIVSWELLSRFVFPQDSGSAITGTGRVDLFWGNGDYAKVAANTMKEEGYLYFLVRKGYPGM